MRTAQFESAEMKYAPRVWFLVSYAILELPVRRVAVAYDALRNPKTTWISCLYVVLGFLCLPLCVLFWFLRFATANITDLLRVLFSRCLFYIAKLFKIAHRPSVLVAWPFLLPPLDEAHFGCYMGS